MSSSILAFAYLAPPANGGTNAGDMFFNTAQSWQINGTTYDLDDGGDPRARTRDRHGSQHRHRGGHVPGLRHHQAGCGRRRHQPASEPIYNSRQNDFFDANGPNDSSRYADDISSYIDSNGQLTLSALDSTTPVMIGVNDIDWYKITVPASTTGTMVVRMQSTGLSLLAPTLAVYNCGGNDDARAADFLHHG